MTLLQWIPCFLWLTLFNSNHGSHGKHGKKRSPLVGHRIGQCGAFIANVGSAILLLKEHRSALITAAVTGKINVEDLA